MYWLESSPRGTVLVSVPVRRAVGRKRRAGRGGGATVAVLGRDGGGSASVAHCGLACQAGAAVVPRVRPVSSKNCELTQALSDPRPDELANCPWGVCPSNCRRRKWSDVTIFFRCQRGGVSAVHPALRLARLARHENSTVRASGPNPKSGRFCTGGPQGPQLTVVSAGANPAHTNELARTRVCVRAVYSFTTRLLSSVASIMGPAGAACRSD